MHPSEKQISCIAPVLRVAAGNPASFALLAEGDGTCQRFPCGIWKGRPFGRCSSFILQPQTPSVHPPLLWCCSCSESVKVTANGTARDSPRLFSCFSKMHQCRLPVVTTHNESRGVPRVPVQTCVDQALDVSATSRGHSQRSVWGPGQFSPAPCPRPSCIHGPSWSRAKQRDHSGRSSGLPVSGARPSSKAL